MKYEKKLLIKTEQRSFWIYKNLMHGYTVISNSPLSDNPDLKFIKVADDPVSASEVAVCITLLSDREIEELKGKDNV